MEFIIPGVTKTRWMNDSTRVNRPLIRTASGLLVLLAGLLFSACSKRQPAGESTTNSSSGNPLTAPVDYIGAAGKAQRTASKVIETAGLKQAIGQFAAVEGRYPKSLEELVAEKYLPALPKAPPGQKIIYNPTNGEVRIE
jgi:hypothetical protein